MNSAVRCLIITEISVCNGIYMIGKLLDHVAEDILSDLDVDDLKNAELVSKGWQQTVLQSRAWSKILHKKVSYVKSLSFLSC